MVYYKLLGICSSLCYTLGLRCLSILYRRVCISYPQTPNPLLPPPPLSLTTTSLCSGYSAQHCPFAAKHVSV